MSLPPLADLNLVAYFELMTNPDITTYEMVDGVEVRQPPLADRPLEFRAAIEDFEFRVAWAREFYHVPPRLILGVKP